MQPIRLIASDLDGTLLKAGASVPSPHTIELIKEINKEGIFFAVCSGRQYENLRMLFDPIKDDISYICCNGGICIHRGEVIYENYIDRPLACEIIRDIERTDGCRAMVSARGFEAISDQDERFYHYMTHFVKADTKRFQDEFCQGSIFYQSCSFLFAHNEQNR